MLSLLHQRVTKGSSRRRLEVNNNNNRNNNKNVNNFNNEEKRKGTRVEGRRDERMRSEEKGGRRSAEERGEGRFSEEKGGRQSVEEEREGGRLSVERGGRRSAEERKGASRAGRRCSGEERRGKGETQCSFVEGGGGSGEEESIKGRSALISSSPHCEMPEKGLRRRRRKEGEAVSEVRQKKRGEEEIQHQSLAPLSPVPDYPSISPRLSRSIQCLATLDNIDAER